MLETTLKPNEEKQESAPSSSGISLAEQQPETSSETKPLPKKWQRDKLLSETRGWPTCIIPARKGSKRLKNKNKLLLDGKPLVQYAIDAAKDSGIFANIIVSSNDMDILEIAYDSDEYTPPRRVVAHNRPAIFTTDKVQVKDVCRFLFRAYQATDVTCLLMPSNPFVTAEDIKKAYELLWKKGANYVLSVKRALPPPQWACKVAGGWLELVGSHNELLQAQKLEPLYYHDGGLILFTSIILLAEYDLDFHGSRCYSYRLPYSVDIDTEEDLKYAEILMEKIKREKHRG